MYFKEINSKENSLFKKIKDLKTKKGREKASKFLIEGERLIEEAIHNNVNIDYLVVSENYKLIDKKHNFPVIKISNKLFLQLSDTVNPQGIMAVVNKPFYSFENLKLSKPLIIIIDGLQDPGNLGTIIRTSAAAGSSAVFLTKNTVDLYNPKTIRASMGAIFQVPIFVGLDINVLISWHQENNISIIVADINADKDYFSIDMSGAVSLVIGNENSGPSKEWLESALFSVKIPLIGKTESLNASVAAGILIYEAVRQRFK